MPGRATTDTDTEPATAIDANRVAGPARRTGPREPILALGGLDVDRDGARVCVRLWGEHDLTTVEMLSTALTELTEDLDVVVDLSGVTFMGGSTVGALVSGRMHLAASNRTLLVRSPSRAQRHLLEICDLGDLIETDDGEVPPRTSAKTALETWVEIPTRPRSVKTSTPVEAKVVVDEPDRASR